MPTFLAPLWSLLGLLAIPIITLYILRQKRPDLTISSTLLWSKTLADMQASSPFQRLRRNLLLILQLLILAAITITLMRPVMQTKASTTSAGVIIIDDTASMQATDGGPDKQTRLEFAKAQALKLVDNMRSGDRYMLIADSGGIDQVQCGFTSDRDELKATIKKIKPVDTVSDLSVSIRVAVTNLRAIGGEKSPTNTPSQPEGTLPGRIFILSDGCGVHLPLDIKGLDDILTFIKIGSSNHNVGIARLAVSPVPKTPRTYDVFVSVVNAGDELQTINVGLAYGSPEKFIKDGIQQVTIPARSEGALGQRGVTFEKVVADPGKIFVLLDAKGDQFPLDNTAYGLLEPARKPKVILVSDFGDDVLFNFLRTATEVGQIDGQWITPEKYKASINSDLVIFDRVTPREMPNADVLLVRPGGSAGGFTVIGELENPPVLRWKREHPMMAYAELGQLKINHALKLRRDPDAEEIVSSTDGPLILTRDVGPSRRTILAFDPDPNLVPAESNWGVDPSMLIFLQNVLDQTRTRHFIGMPQLLASGQAAHVYDLNESATLTTPLGDSVNLNPKDGAAEFAATDHVGFYAVKSGDHSATFAVNLLSPVASDITPQPLQLGNGGNVQEARSVATVNKEVWPILALAALLVLVGEWWVYHRRIA